MLELPVVAKIDEKNGIIDGRDYAMKCIMLAYRVLGAYADGDEDTYRALKKIIHHQAQLELHMNDEDEPNDLMVPHLMVSRDTITATPTERWKAHLKDTAPKTKNLLDVAAAIS